MTEMRLVRLVAIACFASSLFAADASIWDALVKKYVSAESRVDYRRWKQDGTIELDKYLQQLAEPGPSGVSQPAQKAELINAYNALTIRWVLQHYPIESVWRTPHPFTEARHMLNGEKVSLETIEKRLRKMGDPRIHGALVCAARSCPPLRREAYVADRIDRQLDDNVRSWLANDKLNQFFPEKHLAMVSMIFDWYRADFDSSGESVQKFLARYGVPGTYTTIKHIPYHWGLNDTTDLGKNYTGGKFYWDYLRNKV